MTYHTGALACPEQGALDDVIETDRYPLHRPESPEWCAVVAGVRADLACNGAATLAGFIRPVALDSIAAQLDEAARHVQIREHVATVYSRYELEEDLPVDDPRRTRLVWRAGHVTRDMIPAFAESHRLYVSPQFKTFLAACLGRQRIFEYADPLAGLVATILPSGGQYPWHYDTNEFVATLMIQAPEAGGRFEYCKDLRRPGHENLDGLRRVLDGAARASIRTIDSRPGDLQLFLGRYSLHQVTPVEGSRARRVLVFSYSDRPGVIGPLDRTRSVYGRVTEAHLVAAEARPSAEDGLIL